MCLLFVERSPTPLLSIQHSCCSLGGRPLHSCWCNILAILAAGAPCLICFERSPASLLPMQHTCYSLSSRPLHCCAGILTYFLVSGCAEVSLWCSIVFCDFVLPYAVAVVYRVRRSLRAFSHGPEHRGRGLPHRGCSAKFARSAGARPSNLFD